MIAASGFGEGAAPCVHRNVRTASAIASPIAALLNGHMGGSVSGDPFASPGDRLKGHPQERQHSAADLQRDAGPSAPGEGCRMCGMG
jgi:hypothetical protein